MPEKMFNFGVELEKNPFSFSFIGRYVGKIYGDDENKDRVSNVYGSYDLYFTADTKLAYRIKDFAILSFSVDNIFDRDYFYYYRCPGRSWSTELTIKY
jgi:iron complex outermembrane receptor protein